MAKIIGIDLGTSNSAAAAMMGGKPVLIPSSEGITVSGGKAFPSVVAFTKEGNLIIGEHARRQIITNPENTVTAFKRKMGSSHIYKIQEKEYKPQQISAFLLQKIKKDAEDFLGEKIEKAVITVPAYFDDNQRQATKDAGSIAGLDVVRIINEPTAASLAYGLDKSEEDLKIMVFDFGGGTLDVTMMRLGGGVFEVMSTSGDTQLGGTDMDQIITDYVVDVFKKDTGSDPTADKTAMIRIKDSAEKAKIELSSVVESEINLPYITYDQTGPKNLITKLSRAKLDDLIRSTVEKCRNSIMNALSDAKLSPDDIDKILLIGGPTRMPIVRSFVESIMGKKPETGVDPMEAVAIGAAIQAGILGGEIRGDIVLLDVTPLTLGVEVLGGLTEPLIDRNTTIPTTKAKIFTTAADNQTSVTINVVQGERTMAADNVSLGSFNLGGIPPTARGVPQIDVKFDLDADGILNVAAKDLGTQKEAKITITASIKLAKDEIDKMKKDAEVHTEQDRARREKVETRNEAENFIYSTEKLLREQLKDKISEEQKLKVEAAIKELKDVLDKDLDTIKLKLDELKRISSEVNAALYQHIPQSGAKQWKYTTTETPSDQQTPSE